MNALRGLSIALLLAPLAAFGDSPVLISERGEIRFTARYEGQPLEGVFRRFRVELRRDESGRPLGLRVVVGTGSADMNDADVNEELAKRDFFDVENFPEAVFSSETISRGGDAEYSADGWIGIKDVRRALAFPFRLHRSDDALVLEGAVDVSRTAWRIGLGEWSATDLIADSVEIRFRIEFPGASG